MFGHQHELDAALLSRSQSDTLETLQFLHGTRHTCRHVSDVELHDFIAGALAGILNFEANGDSPVGTYARCA